MYRTATHSTPMAQPQLPCYIPRMSSQFWQTLKTGMAIMVVRMRWNGSGLRTVQRIAVSIERESKAGC